MPLLWINEARSNLSAASDNYAKIQRELDRYNKIFETYANANPETQMRAASVMRQALNEYNWLKRQQQENAVRIYEAQNWVDYYNNNNNRVQTPVNIWQAQPSQAPSINEVWSTPQSQPVQEIAVVNTNTPWTLNNNAWATVVEADALETDTTMNVPYNPTLSQLQRQNMVTVSTPQWVINAINSQTPKYSNTTIWQVTPKYTVDWVNYWAGSIVGLNTPSSVTPSRNKSSVLWPRKITLLRAK